ncbi:condensation domain-containing protein [Micromonospora sp. NPDC048843]|uniref:condensation domain-containing protein n=1 Tax=Micromonospora sp. NPDC048843 TaxID=3155389 RepID=UPI0033D2F4BF
MSRADSQVKVRGFRIETGEIESALMASPGVALAAVTVREDRAGDRRLVAYVVPAAGTTVEPGPLRKQLGETLPDYMVPAAIVALDALPRTPNGKLDTAALPAPTHQVGPGSREPRSAREELLGRLFAEVLGLERVGVDEDFFGLGGDSILSLQLVGRARAAGLTLSPRDVFEHRTVEALADVVTEAAVPVVTDTAGDSGEVTPMPITRWLHDLAGDGGPIDSYHQSMLVQVPAEARLDDLAAALQTVIDHHDALRLRGTWNYEIRPRATVPAVPLLRRVDIRGLGDDELPAVLREHGVAAAGELAPRDGEMLRAVWFDRGPEPGLLLLVLHHLVVDGVSWRILLPDLAAAWRAHRAGAAPQLPPAGTALRDWAHRLAREAENPRRTAELPMWRAIAEAGSPPLTDPLDRSRDTTGSTGHLIVTLPAEVTEPLLTEVPAAFRAEINDVLLTALALAVGRWRRERGPVEGTGVRIDLEGHGREQEALPGTDLTRTVGWFTALYPVHLDPGDLDEREVWSGGPAAGTALKRVKEQLRRIPDKGLGYGLLRYLNPRTAAVLAEAEPPQLRFNYLGRVGATREGDWAPVPGGGFGGGRDPRMPLAYAVDLLAGTRESPAGPELVCTWTWAGELLTEPDVQALADAWGDALRALARQATQPDAGGFTPSDVSLSLLDQNEIDMLQAEWRTEK